MKAKVNVTIVLIVLLVSALLILSGCTSLQTYQQGRETVHTAVHDALDLGDKAVGLLDAVAKDGTSLYEFIKCLLSSCPPPAQ